MARKIEKIDLNNTDQSHLPLGFKKVKLNKIPQAAVEEKLTIYNKRYKFASYQAFQPDKPVSKILK